ncbi:MAG TPA: ABC transporter permease [Burkholderiales bacterium]|nr:ABC transporter permease [Burkholderiales bacterium]
MNIAATGTLLQRLHWIVAKPLFGNRGRVALSLAGIALGVALGGAVHLINSSALNEFDLAIHELAGDADIIVRGPRGGFPDSLYPQLARMPDVAAISPMVNVEAPLADHVATLKIIGIDPFRAMQVQPVLVKNLGDSVRRLLAPDAILLSSTAAHRWQLQAGDTLRIRVGTATVALTVIGLLPPGAFRQPVGIMDIAAAQWRLARLGTLDRIDLRLRPGTDIGQFRRRLQAALPAGVEAVTPHTEAGRGASLSRAYRINLGMLALIALFTGGFLVFSTQVLAVLRRRAQIALLRVLGVTRRALVLQLLTEGAVIGAVGAALGVAAGYAIAHYALAHFGADLGAGYFRGAAPQLHFEPAAAALFFVLGVVAATLGALAPALEAARRAPAAALRAGDADSKEIDGRRRRPTWPVIVLFAAAAACAAAPAVDGVPFFGYCAIALILFGAILLMPRVATVSLQRLPLFRYAPLQLAVAQLRAAPRRAAISMAAIVVSFSLMVAMAIMVTSFRRSFDTWLSVTLPADLYLRAARGGDSGFLGTGEQSRISGIPGIASVHLRRERSLLLDPRLPPVMLLARPIDARTAQDRLPMIGAALVPPPQAPPPVWISEVVRDLYHMKPGQRIELPLAGKHVPFTVAGVWRDYARQSGAIVINRALYMQLTGDARADDAAIRLAPGVSAAAVEQALRNRLPDSGIEITDSSHIRTRSLRIFDRTFAVTYALEAVAILIGLFGVSVSFSAQAAARRSEFGMLRHVGMTRREVAAMLGAEGLLMSGLATGFGLVLGWVMSLILIFVVNRQSFHWSMELHIPWLVLAATAAALIVLAALTAVLSGRQAMSGDVLQAVKEDW